MSIEWVIGTLVLVIIGMAGALYHHVRECREVRAAIATISERLTIIARELGDHETGLRGSMHRLREETREALLRIGR